MAKIQMKRLPALLVAIDEALAALPAASPFTAGWPARVEALDKLFDRLATTEGATLRSNSGGVVMFILAGVASSATSGREGALRNWRRAARAKLDNRENEDA